MNKSNVKKSTKKKSTKKNSTKKNSTKKNSIKDTLTIYKLKKIYKDIISNDKLNYKGKLLEFIFNYLLVLHNYRTIVQFLYNDKLYKILNDIFFSNYKMYNYKIFNSRLIVYNSKINIKELNTKFGKDFANLLGDFYICANNEKLYYNSTHRITISVSDKLNAFPYNELYAQMCKQSLITDENINKLKKIAKEISIILQQFDKNLIIKLNINKFNKILGIPYKSIIDKQFIFN